MWQESSFKSNSVYKQQVYKTIKNCVFKDDENFLKLVKDKEIDNLWDLVTKKVGIDVCGENQDALIEEDIEALR
jgi:hypothetical protein